MSGETPVTLVGNLVEDPSLRYTPQGTAVCNFRIASTPRQFDRQTNQWVDGQALFLSGTAWRQLAENIANSLNKGDRVIVTGNLTQRSYQTREGEPRTVFDVQAEEVGPSLRFATSLTERNPRGTGGTGNYGGAPGGQQQNSTGGSAAPGGGAQQGGFNAQGDDDPWSAAPPQGSFDDSENPPF